MWREEVEAGGVVHISICTLQNAIKLRHFLRSGENATSAKREKVHTKYCQHTLR